MTQGREDNERLAQFTRGKRLQRYTPLPRKGRPMSYEPVKYEEYIKSARWRRVRERYKSCRPWVCLCGEHEHLELHHLTYKRLQRELLEDLQPLCQGCHSLVHQLVREGLMPLDLRGFFDIGRAIQRRHETQGDRPYIPEQSYQRILWIIRKRKNKKPVKLSGLDRVLLDTYGKYVIDDIRKRPSSLYPM